MKAFLVAPDSIGNTVPAQPPCLRRHQQTPGRKLEALATPRVAGLLAPAINRGRQ